MDAQPSPRQASESIQAESPAVAILTGGGDRPYALGLAGSLIGEGLHFDFIGSDFLESEELIESPNVEFRNLRGDMRPDVSALRKVARIARYYVKLIVYAARARPRVFHVLWNNKFEYLDRTLIMLYYRLLGKRVALTVHNVNARRRDGSDSWLNRLTLRCQYRFASHLFVHTEKMKGELLSEFGVAEDRISVIPFGINDTVPRTSLTRAEARRRSGLLESERVLLFFGNIAPYKGLEYLVEALALVRQAYTDSILVIAGRPKGSENYWATIESRLQELELADFVKQRIEYVPDADTEIYFKAADVLVLPYTFVFQSGVLFLSYSFGLPVIASDVGSLSDDVVEGRTGFICPPTDVPALAETIKRYFSSPLFESLAERRGEIREYARERYSWETVASVSRRVYARLNEQ